LVVEDGSPLPWALSSPLLSLRIERESEKETIRTKKDPVPFQNQPHTTHKGDAERLQIQKKILRYDTSTPVLTYWSWTGASPASHHDPSWHQSISHHVEVMRS
jgi:hypothetical protein